MNKNSRSGFPYLFAALVLASCLALGGCASTGTGPDASQGDKAVVSEAAARSQENLAKRVLERRRAMEAQDWDKVYSYMAPSYRALVEKQAYTARFASGGGSYIGAKIVNINCEDDIKCKVRLEITMQILLLRRFGDSVQGIDETWVWEDGNWWMFEKI